MEFWLAQTLNGLSFGALLFLLASGLSLIFGLMRIVNIAHGSYYLLGAYIALSVVKATHSFARGAGAAAAGVGGVGFVMQRVFLARFYRQTLAQVLLTMGFSFVFADVALLVWGGDPQRLPTPSLLARSVPIGPVFFPAYRAVMIVVGAAVALLLWLVLEKTRIGATLRAAVDDQEMARGLGIDVGPLLTGMFALGAALAGIGGVMGAPFLGAYPGADSDVLPLAFAVVIIGGLGRPEGAGVGGALGGRLPKFCQTGGPQLPHLSHFFRPANLLSDQAPR